MKKKKSKHAIEHEEWLKRHGYHSSQLKEKKKKKESVIPNYDCSKENVAPMSNSIHSSSKKEKISYQEKMEVSSQYTIAPAYNKGSYQVIAKSDITTAGRKV